MSFFSQNHTETNFDDWTITKKTTSTIKHENLAKMKILKVARWALSLTKMFCTSGPNLVILAWMGGELRCGQTKNGVNLEYQVKFCLEGQSRSVHKTIGTLTKVFCIFWPNWVILDWTGPELLHRMTHTDRHTHTQRRRKRQYPKAKTGLG